MIEISNKKHVSTIIESINKVYKRAKINGKLFVMDIYYINVIKQLLDNTELTINIDQRNTLINLYTKFSLMSDDICLTEIYKSYQTNRNIKFEQAEVKDCNTYNAFPRIYYWQETFENDNTEIINLINFDYLDNKPNDTYESFIIGKDISYDMIGKICFFMLDSKLTDNFIIKDTLGNNVTHAFDKYYNSLLRGNLYISQNIYAHGNLFFKINK